MIESTPYTTWFLYSVDSLDYWEIDYSYSPYSYLTHGSPILIYTKLFTCQSMHSTSVFLYAYDQWCHLAH